MSLTLPNIQNINTNLSVNELTILDSLILNGPLVSTGTVNLENSDLTGFSQINVQNHTSGSSTSSSNLTDTGTATFYGPVTIQDLVTTNNTSISVGSTTTTGSVTVTDPNIELPPPVTSNGNSIDVMIPTGLGVSYSLPSPITPTLYTNVIPPTVISNTILTVNSFSITQISSLSFVVNAFYTVKNTGTVALFSGASFSFIPNPTIPSWLPTLNRSTTQQLPFGLTMIYPGQTYSSTNPTPSGRAYMSIQTNPGLVPAQGTVSATDIYLSIPPSSYINVTVNHLITIQ